MSKFLESRFAPIVVIGALGGAVFGILFYFGAIAFTLRNQLFTVAVFSAVIWLLIIGFGRLSDWGEISTAFFSSIGIAVVFVLIVSVANSTLFNARAYSSQFIYTEKEFAEFEGSIDNIPLLDKASSDNIAKRKFGELTDFVSQYKIIDSEQIIYKGKPVRLSVLEHTSLWSWKRNKTTPGYILVDMQTHKAELVRTEKPIVYSESTYFGKNIKRYIRKNYKNVMFMNPTAELGDDGQIYWVAPTYERIVGLYGGRLINGAIVVNAHTGEHTRYNKVTDIPEWIDNVYPSDYIMTMYDYKGELSNGFWNTLFSKAGMTMTTDGYNYLPIGEDNWIYTGITSVSMADESNIAFILTNKRTMETHYFQVSGAEEYSAMEAAEGEVQHLGYTATFPLLLNIEGTPTYVLSLKDKNELVKMYAMIQVEDYRNVVVDTDLNTVKNKYLSRVKGTEYVEERPMADAPAPSSGLFTDLQEVSGVLSDRNLINVKGDSYIVFKLAGVDEIYVTPAVANMELLFTPMGEQIEVKASKIK